jgi:hypothetical protein
MSRIYGLLMCEASAALSSSGLRSTLLHGSSPQLGSDDDERTQCCASPSDAAVLTLSKGRPAGSTGQLLSDPSLQLPQSCLNGANAKELDDQTKVGEHIDSRKSAVRGRGWNRGGTADGGFLGRGREPGGCCCRLSSWSCSGSAWLLGWPQPAAASSRLQHRPRLPHPRRASQRRPPRPPDPRRPRPRRPARPRTPPAAPRPHGSHHHRRPGRARQSCNSDDRSLMACLRRCSAQPAAPTVRPVTAPSWT